MSFGFRLQSLLIVGVIPNPESLMPRAQPQIADLQGRDVDSKMGVSENRGSLFWGPYNRDLAI